VRSWTRPGHSQSWLTLLIGYHYVTTYPPLSIRPELNSSCLIVRMLDRHAWIYFLIPLHVSVNWRGQVPFLGRIPSRLVDRNTAVVLRCAKPIHLRPLDRPCSYATSDTHSTALDLAHSISWSYANATVPSRLAQPVEQRPRKHEAHETAKNVAQPEFTDRALEIRLLLPAQP